MMIEMILSDSMIHPWGHDPNEMIIAFRIEARVTTPALLATALFPWLTACALPTVPFSGIARPRNRNTIDGNNDQADSERPEPPEHIKHVRTL